MYKLNITDEEIKAAQGLLLPVNASILVTEDCNLRCTYCFEKHKKNKMSVPVAKKTIEFLAGNAIKTGRGDFGLTFFGGEPTLAPDTLETLFEHGYNVAKSNGLEFNIGMITNATIMNERLYSMFEKYRDLCNFNVQLSVDGIQKVQDMYRVTANGKGSFHMVEKNIPIYKELFKDRPNSLHIHGCLNKNSLPYLFESYMFFKYQWGLDRIWFLTIMEEDWDDNDIEVYRQEMGKIYNHIMSIVRKENNTREIFHYAPLDRCLNTNKTISGLPCGAGRDYCTITANGELYPCHQIYFNDPEKDTIMGNIWTGVDEDRRRMFLEYDGNDLSCDKDCTHGNCYRCIAVNWVWNGSILSQMKGQYCKLAKIDQYYQTRMREELVNMGLIKNTRSNNNSGSGDGCLGKVRDRVYKSDDNGNCVLVEYPDNPEFNDRHIDSDKACDVVTHDRVMSDGRILPVLDGEGEGCAECAECGDNNNAPLNIRNDNYKVLETWQNDGVVYKRIVLPDGSIDVITESKTKTPPTSPAPYNVRTPEKSTAEILAEGCSGCNENCGENCHGSSIEQEDLELIGYALKTLIEKVNKIEEVLNAIQKNR